MEIRHVPGLACQALNLALSQRTIMSGFAKTGIAPFNPDVFTEYDFIEAVENNAQSVELEGDLEEDDQPRIIIVDTPTIGREEEVVTSGSNTPRPLSSMSHASSYGSILSEIGPLQAATPKQKSKRGRKAMESAELTSPDNIAVLKQKAAEKALKQATPKKTRSKKATPKKTTPKKTTPKSKRAKIRTPSPITPPSDVDEIDVCIVCLKMLPRKLNAANSIKCNKCSLFAHLKCANMRASFFTCKSCDSDLDVDDDVDEEDDYE